MVEASTQTENIVKLDHAYTYDKASKSVSTQHSTPEFSIENTLSDTNANFILD